MLNVAFQRRRTSIVLLFLLLIASLMLPVAAGRAESEDRVRVIIVLRAPAAADRYDLMAPDAIAQVQEQFAPAAVAAGAREVARLDTLPAVILDAPRSALNRLANHPLVANVAEDALAMPHLSSSVLLIHADLAQQEANGAGVAIAIVDTGVDAAHPFLGGRVIAEACFSTNNAAQGATSLCPGNGSAAFGPGAAAPCSLSNCDHGTHVAGIAAGNSGVAPGASIIAVQVFSRIANCSAFSLPSPCALSYVSDQLRAFDWLASTTFTPPLAIVNLSLGVGTFTSVTACDTSQIGTAMFPAIATLRNQGVTTVASSGNNGATNALSLPGCLSNVVSVGATTKTNPEQVASFSNSAPFLTLLAPGVGIVSSTTGGGFAPKSGTSMAAPHVAGALALLRSARPGYPSDAYVTALVNTGTPILDTRNGVIKPRIDVAAALGALAPMQKRAFLPLVVRP
ncbi:MAG: S8 family serine peptidase [Roseiflexus sp.]|jgi:subtilisin family serine protease|nr:S8 family serine peptidase [Roseiflexus sp.]MBO9364668.1 S8 family serine peptidase [Roseiflexus sp.]MBO9382832.1 S8 family serine peptidase [Roseiflexus sp.]MBO9389562.1 S8 family serine peptidase [Roseiflexus sp.]